MHTNLTTGFDRGLFAALPATFSENFAIHPYNGLIIVFATIAAIVLLIALFSTTSKGKKLNKQIKEDAEHREKYIYPQYDIHKRFPGLDSLKGFPASYPKPGITGGYFDIHKNVHLFGELVKQQIILREKVADLEARIVELENPRVESSDPETNPEK